MVLYALALLVQDTTPAVFTRPELAAIQAVAREALAGRARAPLAVVRFQALYGDRDPPTAADLRFLADSVVVVLPGHPLAGVRPDHGIPVLNVMALPAPSGKRVSVRVSLSRGGRGAAIYEVLTEETPDGFAFRSLRLVGIG